MRLISFIYLGILSAFLQAQIFPEIFNRGWQPDIFLVWVILMAFIKGRKSGIWAALIAGFIRDVVLGSFFGLHMLSYLAIATFLPFLGTGQYEEQWGRSMVVVFVISVLDGLVRMLFLWIMLAPYSMWGYIGYFIFPGALCNMLLAYGVHRMIWKLTTPDEFFGDL